MDLPDGESCPAIRKSAEASGVVVSGRRISFLGPEGLSWSLARRQNRLQGIVAGGSAAANLRLDGEVDLALAPPDASRQPVPSARKGGVSGKAIGAFLGANVVAGAALVGVNQLGKTTPDGGKASCSPRNCIVTSPTDPCDCNTMNVTGGDCGATTTGVAYLGVCNPEAGLPCEASLTCAGGICDARDGRCPF